MGMGNILNKGEVALVFPIPYNKLKSEPLSIFYEKLYDENTQRMEVGTTIKCIS